MALILNILSFTVLLALIVCCSGAPKKPRTIPAANPKGLPRLPANRTCHVLIIGGGVAGMSAATELAERGFKVTIRESAAMLGGRLATRNVTSKALNQNFSISNTFVSWMHNHYQFLNITRRLKVEKNFKAWDKIDYYFEHYKPEVIYNKDSFPWNILGILWRSKNIHFGDDVLAVFRSGDLRNYNYDKVFQSFDGMTFKDWRAKEKMPQTVYDILMEPMIAEIRNNPNKTSAAEMLTYFQLYYMSDKKADEAMRSVANVTYDKAIINPWVSHLKKTKNVTLNLGKPVNELEFIATSISTSNVTSDDTAPGEKYKYVIMATDLENTRVILKNSLNDNDGVLGISKPLTKMLNKMQYIGSAAPYKILRVWYSQQPAKTRPAVINTPDMTPLNLVIQHHLLEDEYIKWAKKTNGSMIEYQLNQWTYPDMNATEILKRIKPSIQKIFPELISNKKTKVLLTSLDTYQNAPSFLKNMEQHRPNTTFAGDLGIPNLFFAGDWLKTGYPAAMMEKAVSTGREAANEVLIREGVRQVELTVTSSIGPGF